MQGEAEELRLLENVELKLGLAESDAAFASLTESYLAAILLALNSPHASVRAKVAALASHLLKRVKSSDPQRVPLPLAKLLDLFRYKDSNALIRNFCLIFLQLGLSRASPTTIGDEVVSKIVRGVHSLNKSEQTSLLHLLMLALPLYVQSESFEASSRSGDSAQLLGIESPPMSPEAFSDAAVSKSALLNFATKEAISDSLTLLEHALLVLLYQLPVIKAQSALQLGMQKLELQQAQSSALQGPRPCLSKEDVQSVTNGGKAEWTSAAEPLARLKLSIVKLAVNRTLWTNARIVCPDAEALRYLLLVVGANDTNADVAKLCDDALRKNGPYPLESALLIKHMQRLYLGDAQAHQLPAPVSFKIRLLQLCSTSSRAANSFPQTMLMISDSVYETSNSLENVHGKRLRRAGLQFLQWVSRNASPESLEVHAQELLESLVALSSVESSAVDTQAAGTALETIGHIAQRLPHLFEGRFDLAQTFFARLNSGSGQETGLRSSLQDALLCMLPCFSKLPCAREDDYRQLCFREMQSPVSAARFVALKYAIEFQSRDLPFSKFVAVIGASDATLHVAEQAQSYLFERPTVLLETLVVDLPRLFAYKNYSGNALVQGSNLSCRAFGYLIEFLRFLWLTETVPSFVPDRLYDAGVVENLQVRSQLLSQPLSLSTAQCFARLVQSALLYDNGDGQQALHTQTALFFVELLTLTLLNAWDVVHGTQLLDFEWFSQLILYKTVRPECRMAMSQSFSLLLTLSTDREAVGSMVKELLLRLAKERNTEHGALSCLGFVAAHVMHRYYPNFEPYINRESLLEVFGLVYGALELTQLPMVQLAGTQALAHIALFCPINDFFATRLLVERLEDLVKRSEETKVRETAIAALSHTAFYCSKELCKEIVSFLLSSHEFLSKHLELCFAVGGALAAIAAGWDALNLCLYDDIPQEKGALGLMAKQRNTVCDLSFIIDSIVTDLIPSGKPTARKASCLWIATLLKLTGHLPAMKQQLSKIHSSLKSLLIDKDAMTQEAASQSLGLVYDFGDDAVKETLVNELVSIFALGRSLAGGQVTNDQQNLLDISLPSGSTESGFTNVTTYGSIISLAKETGQPGLVYQFMQLANQSAIWTSRQGATMGFSSILEKANEALKPHLAEILPALYRFRFDPNPTIASTMQQIWTQLVPNSAVYKPFIHRILETLLEHANDTMWRHREAACAGIAELLSLPTLREELLANSIPETVLQKMFKNCFQALDDIKETVRSAALKACQSLTTAAISSANPAVYNIVMPFFIDVGITSNAKTVSQFSLKALLRVAKLKRDGKTGEALKQWLPQLLVCLLESLTLFEPQVLNYLTFHVSSQLEFDRQRAKAASSNNAPIMEGVEYAIGQLDKDTLKVWMPMFLAMVKRGNTAAGLPTKAGCARVFVLLYIYKPELMSEYSSLALNALKSALRDKNVAVRQLYSVAIGYSGRFVTVQELEAFICDPLQQAYVSGLSADSEDAIGNRLLVALVLGELNKHAADAMQDARSKFLPLTYFGCHDLDKSVREAFEQLWESATGGSKGAIRLYVPELLALLEPLVAETSSFAVKEQIGLTLQSVAQNSSFGSQLPQVVSLLLDALKGRSWKGKQALLLAMAYLSINHADALRDNGNIREALIRELKKNKRDEYKVAAVVAVGQWYAHLEMDEATFSTVFETVADFILPKPVSDGMEVDSDSESESGATISVLLREASLLTVVQCLSKTDSVKYGKMLGVVLELFSRMPASSLPYSTQKKLISALVLILQQLDSLGPASDVVSSDTVKYYAAVCGSMFSASNSYGQVRQEAATTFLQFLKLLPQQCKQIQENRQFISELAKTNLEQEALAFVRSTLECIVQRANSLPENF